MTEQRYITLKTIDNYLFTISLHTLKSKSAYFANLDDTTIDALWPLQLDIFKRNLDLLMHVILYGPYLPLLLTVDERNALIKDCQFYLVDYNDDISICFNCYKKDALTSHFCIKCGKNRQCIIKIDEDLMSESGDNMSVINRSHRVESINETHLKCRTNLYIGKLNNQWHCDHNMVITCCKCKETVLRKYMNKNMASIL